MSEEQNMEYSKILAKIMQNSYKRKEIEEIVDRIILKLNNTLFDSNDATNVMALRLEFEELRKEFFKTHHS